MTKCAANVNFISADRADLERVKHVSVEFILKHQSVLRKIYSYISDVADNFRRDAAGELKPPAMSRRLVQRIEPAIFGCAAAVGYGFWALPEELLPMVLLTVLLCCFAVLLSLVWRESMASVQGNATRIGILMFAIFSGYAISGVSRELTPINGKTLKSLDLFSGGALSPQWTSFINLDGDFGRSFMERLKSQKNATWYIILMSPYGFQQWPLGEMIAQAATRNVDTKIAYQVPDTTMCDPALGLMWRFLFSDQTLPQNRDKLAFQCKSARGPVDKLEDALYREFVRSPDISHQKVKVYHSSAPTFYLAWLSVPKGSGYDSPSVTRRRAPVGTFGIVMPYAVPATYDDRPGFFLESVDSTASSQTANDILLDYYLDSSVRYFDDGVRNDLNRAGPYLTEVTLSAVDKRTGFSVCDPKSDEAPILCNRDQNR